MPGCANSSGSDRARAFSTVRSVPELRSIITAIGDSFEHPLGIIRSEIEAHFDRAASAGPERPHLTTTLAMCEDVADLTQRYLDYIDQVESLPEPRLGPERLDELLTEIDRRLMPEAFGKGVVWGCSVEGPIRLVLTDRALCLEALMEWASLAVDSARPGESVSFCVATEQAGEDRPRLTLSSPAEELIPELSSLREDPLFNQLVCLKEVGTDAGSRLALSFERLAMLGIEVGYDPESGGPIRSVHFRFPPAPPKNHREPAFTA